jgi:hypothetical protein
MGHSSNREPRRFWSTADHHRLRVPCASCGAPARPHAASVPFCDECLHGARQRSSADFDELGGQH